MVWLKRCAGSWKSLNSIDTHGKGNNLSNNNTEQRSFVQNSDYGFYDSGPDDVIREKDPISSLHNCISHTAPTETLTKRTDDVAIKQVVIFCFNIKSAPLSCRSFDSLSGISNIQIWTAVNGFRIIQNDFGEHAEFKVMVCFDNLKYIVWRKQSDFEMLHRSVIAASQNGRRKSKANLIWDQIMRRSNWWTSNLSVKYLIWKSLKLGEFLKEALFEIPRSNVLESFIHETYRKESHGV